ncbi:MAG TPA: LPS-assembly protein LptD, partial [Candidatus Tenderia electrophaga]|nr:LPS-assembly protein LptD [Candidatus Tenderia electrophaga]
QSQLFSENRFSGPDRIGDANQITLSLASRLLRADDGREILYGSIGKIVYLDDRQVGLNGNSLNQDHQSDILAEAQFKPNDRLSLKARLTWDTEYDLITERDIRLQYQSDNQHILNLNYRDRGNRITAPEALKQEIDISLLWSLTPRWSMMARRYHSLPDDRTMEKLAGLEYNSCCWAVRAVRRASFVKDSTALSAPFGNLRYSWYVQFELKGLTSLGKRIDELMEEQILGFNAVN